MANSQRYTRLPSIVTDSNGDHIPHEITVYYSSPQNMLHPLVWVKVKNSNSGYSSKWVVLKPETLDDLIVTLIYARAQIGGKDETTAKP